MKIRDVRTEVVPIALAVLAGALLAASCSASQQERAKSDMNDAFIAAQIHTKMAAMDPATVTLVTVDVSHGAVTLTGQVHSAAERDKIDEAARSVSGVTRLDDRLKVNPKAPTAQEIAADLGLQAKVKAALGAQTGVNALKVEVGVHAAVVTLEGSYTTPAMHTVILETVRGVPGVRRVVDRLHRDRNAQPPA
jgi:hyperosmotically inducible periplasmic protein